MLALRIVALLLAAVLHGMSTALRHSVTPETPQAYAGFYSIM